jgi:hypothetical protein
MPSQQGSNLRPLWQIRHALNRQEVTRGGGPIKKMLLNYDRSRNVHENKQNHDKMPDEKSDIYCKVRRILQKTAHLEGQFGPNDAFPVGSVRNFMPTCRQERTMEVH